MENNEICKCVNEYLSDQNPIGAIMIDGKWGAGKSYFINNVLIDSIRKDMKVIKVSLYGKKCLEDIGSELFMSWYLEKFDIIDSKKKKSIFSFISSLVSNLPNFKDFKLDSSMMNSWCNIHNFKNTLIIFEDIERSAIPIIDVLGYVNNLVEQNKAHVILICNEEAILSYDSKIDIRTEKQRSEAKMFEQILRYASRTSEGEDTNDTEEYSENIKRYMISKEKTVFITIKFEGRYDIAVKSIIEEVNDEKMNILLTPENINYVCNIIGSNSGNLRMFISAIKRSKILLDSLDYNEVKFTYILFYSILKYHYFINASLAPDWEEVNKTCNSEEGEYPLFPIVYRYLINHSIKESEKKELLHQLNDFVKNKDYSAKNPVLNTLYNYHIQDEPILIKCFKDLATQLMNDEIHHAQYGKIAFYVTKVNDLIKVDISDIEEYLEKNLLNTTLVDKRSDLFSLDMFDHNRPFLDSYIELQKKMRKALNQSPEEITPWPKFEYKPENIKLLNDSSFYRLQDFVKYKTFLTGIDVKKMGEMVNHSTAMEIDELRKIFLSVYRQNEFYDIGDDEKYLIQILDEVKLLYEDKKKDAIILLQLEFFIGNLTKILENK